MLRGGSQIVAPNANWSTTITGIDNAYFVAREWEIAEGRNFEDEEIRRGGNVVVLGATVARNLFGEADPIGKDLRIRTTPFRVVGVLTNKGQSMMGQDQDDIAFVPLEAARRRIVGRNWAKGRSVAAIYVKFDESADMDEGIARMTALLRQRHRLPEDQESDFVIRNLTEIMNTVGASAQILTLLLSAVAGVSLLVGGIGIMNIMLVSVTERTREIGLRMAVGARPSAILKQFLIEATTLSTFGGAIGVVVGIGLAQLIAGAFGWPTLISPEAIAVAVGFSALVGIFFGFYPARRASRLDPIEALRRV
jgi:putative ABC transport system permease protein